MEIYLLILLCCIVSIIILSIILNKRNKTLEAVILKKHEIEVARKEELKEYFNEEWEQEKERIDNQQQIYESEMRNAFIKLENQYKLETTQYGAELDKLKTQLTEKEKRYEEVTQDLNLYREGKMKEIDGTAAEYEKRKRGLIEQSVEKYREILIEQTNHVLQSEKEKKEKLDEEIEQLKLLLEEERTKRAAINEEIRRQRELEEQQDFYRIQLDPNDTDDVEILRSVAPRLRHPEAINKVIWTGYYQKPLAELRKRLLPNGDISGVYKITRLKTNEIYIGQTTSIDKRWQDHVKSALGVGTLASSQLHRVMAQDGCENFTFEVLEEVPKDKLRERESYYIDFYDSKTYGLNTISGDKNK